MTLAATYAQVALNAVTAHAPVRVGTDVQAVAAVAESLAGPLRDAYLARLFTTAELADVGADVHPAAASTAESLAARFAAKEAVVKVLAPSAGTPRPPWTDIEVRREPSGRPALRLLGAAAAQARLAGLSTWSCSLAHDGGLAVATVVALADHAVTPGSGEPSERLSDDIR